MDELAQIQESLRQDAVEGRSPLFILGAGISAHRVPLLSDLGEWFLGPLSRTTLPEDLTWVRGCAKNLADGNASRRDAADFFSLLQSDTPPFEGLWSQFSSSFLLSGFRVSGWSTKFSGILSDQLTPSPAHEVLAQAVTNAKAYVLSLNFDGLTHRAMTPAPVQSGPESLTREERVARFNELVTRLGLRLGS